MSRLAKPVDLHFWYCGSCMTSYLEKPARCANADMLWYGRYPSGCDEYGLKEKTIRNIVSVEEYSTDIDVGVRTQDGKLDVIGLMGDEEAWDRRKAFLRLLKGGEKT